MAIGRPPIPNELKRRRGTLRPGRVPSPDAVVAVAPIDASVLDLTAAESLEFVMSERPPWLSETDMPKVALLRELLGLVDQRLSIRDSLEAIKAASKIVDELGLSPTARTRLGVAEVKTQSKLAALRAGRDQRDE